MAEMSSKNGGTEVGKWETRAEGQVPKCGLASVVLRPPYL